MLAGDVKLLVSLLLRSAVGEPRVVGDPAGNWKLSKGGEGNRYIRARDDAAAVAILAVAEGRRRIRQGPPKPPSRLHVC